MPCLKFLHQKCFRNRSTSWLHPSLWDALRYAATMIQRNTRNRIRHMRETLDIVLPQVAPKFTTPSGKLGMNITWLGHSTVLVQMNDVSFITDPHFSQEAGANSLFSVTRLRPAVCTVNDLPGSLNAVLVSHNHYDHLDRNTVLQLHVRYGEALKWFVPKNLKGWFTQIGIDNVHEHSWWDTSYMSQNVKVVFTPAQHWSQRTLWDRNKTLWGSWCVLGKESSFFFAGDTGYCADFLEIGSRYGPFTVSALPIGAYEPRQVVKKQHVNPEEAVRIHMDVSSVLSIGIHWGTFPLGTEDVLDPPKQLRLALAKHKLPENCFITTNIGDSISISNK